MPLPVFDELNAEREQNGEALLANPRNAASGTLKLQDSSQVAARKLRFYAYALLTPGRHFASHSAALEALSRYGLPVSDTWRRAARGSASRCTRGSSTGAFHSSTSPVRSRSSR